MIVRISRPLGLRGRLLGEILKRKRDCLLQLRIVAFADGLWILLDFHIRVDAVVLHIPLALRREECDARRGHVAAIHQNRDWADADQAAPGAFAHEGPSLACLKSHGSASPPEPENSLAIITFGP